MAYPFPSGPNYAPDVHPFYPVNNRGVNIGDCYLSPFSVILAGVSIWRAHAMDYVNWVSTVPAVEQKEQAERLRALVLRALEVKAVLR
jgi:hypothetical protein